MYILTKLKKSLSFSSRLGTRRPALCQIATKQTIIATLLNDPLAEHTLFAGLPDVIGSNPTVYFILIFFALINSFYKFYKFLS